MRSSRIFRSLCAALTLVACAGAITGCGSSGDEIPLAKVPPPPESFSRVQAKANIPKSASPTNANELRR
jgi:hypothetical protein